MFYPFLVHARFYFLAYRNLQFLGFLDSKGFFCTCKFAFQAPQTIRGCYDAKNEQGQFSFARDLTNWETLGLCKKYSRTIFRAILVFSCLPGAQEEIKTSHKLESIDLSPKIIQKYAENRLFSYFLLSPILEGSFEMREEKVLLCKT